MLWMLMSKAELNQIWLDHLLTLQSPFAFFDRGTNNQVKNTRR